MSSEGISMPKSPLFIQCFIAAVLLSPVFSLAAPAAQSRQKDTPPELDRIKYIGLDEIEPGMKAYCLTVFNGTLVEKFDFEVLSVIHNFEPRRNAIIVKGTDERFIHAGIVAGCSGSPLYIDGRLAGALAFGWYFSKDPLYGVTPIEEMLVVGADVDSGTADAEQGNMRLSIDFSKPLDLQRIENQIMSALQQQPNSTYSQKLLPMPMVVSGIPDSAAAELDRVFGSFGIMTVPGPSGGLQDSDPNVQLSPGSVLAVPLVSGDIDLAIVGTATEVVDDKVFGFGHSFLGYGPVNLPMATGRIHTVVANTMRSFKLGSPVKTVGTLIIDEAAAVRGIIGEAPSMIPMTINVSRYNDPALQSYQCSVADNRMLTPILLRISLLSAVMQRGNLPPDHTLIYRTKIELADLEPISCENISVNSQVNDLLTETMVPVALLMNNPFKAVQIRSIQCDVEEYDQAMLAGVLSMDVSDYKVKQGEKFTVGAVVETMRGPKKRYTFDLTVPANLVPGKYDLYVMGGAGYLEFLVKAARQRFIAVNVDTIIEALNNILRIRRDRLYCVLVLPQGGITIDRAELPDLPLTKAMVLNDATRTLDTQPYQHWIEQSISTPQVITGAQKIEIEVIQQNQ
jgi:hypothetical protein